MTEDFRFNPNHVAAGSSNGGQFGSSGSGQTVTQKLQSMHEPAGHGSGHASNPWHNGVMAYDPRRGVGPGYDSPHGDPTVHQLQQALNRLGITDDKGKKLADDGKLGPLTTQAIKAAQKRLGLKQDGQVTPALLKQLTSAKSLPAKPATKTSAKKATPMTHSPSALVKPRSNPDKDIFGRADTTPYGDVAYADPGYQADKQKRYPIDTKDHAKAAWSYINQADNASKYSPEDLARVKSRIKAALQKFGVEVGDSGRSYNEEFDMSAVERRFTLMTVEFRAAPGEVPRIGGYAAMFSKVSQNLGGFVEVVERSFFNKSRGDGWPDVMCRYNHDDNMLLGTTGAGTLRLNLDETGLDYNVSPPQARADVTELVQRGDVRKSSFAFRVPKDGEDWGLSDQGYPMRHLLTGQLVDVAPVNVPAYLDTSAALRSLAGRMEADVEEVRSLASQNELRKFFIRTDNAGPAAKPKPKLLGAVAAMELLNRKQDPWAE